MTLTVKVFCELCGEFIQANSFSKDKQEVSIDAMTHICQHNYAKLKHQCPPSLQNKAVEAEMLSVAAQYTSTIDLSIEHNALCVLNHAILESEANLAFIADELTPVLQDEPELDPLDGLAINSSVSWIDNNGLRHYVSVNRFAVTSLRDKYCVTVNFGRRLGRQSDFDAFDDDRAVLYAKSAYAQWKHDLLGVEKEHNAS